MKTSDGKTARVKEIRTALRRWYGLHGRDLPWRRSRDPYAIWVSEIMLQQTRVVAVIDYYARFLERFPTVEALARATEEQVLATWSGLGYYRRARALHAAARQIVDERGGQLPATSESLRALPGIGRYTAAAIASIAFAEPVAVVDGNVERVLERFDGRPRSGEQVWARAQELLDVRAPGDWNQAMMELGATLCTPMAPRCDACPLKKWCKLPGHDVRKKPPARTRRELAYGMARRGERVYLVQRAKDASLMPSMWELPAVKAVGKVAATFQHAITNTDYTITVVEVKKVAKGGKWFKSDELDGVPLTGIARKALRRAGMLKGS